MPEMYILVKTKHSAHRLTFGLIFSAFDFLVKTRTENHMRNRESCQRLFKGWISEKPTASNNNIATSSPFIG